MKHVYAVLVGGLGTLWLALAVLHGQSQPVVRAQAHGYYLTDPSTLFFPTPCFQASLVGAWRNSDILVRI